MPASISVLDESRFGRFRQTAFRFASTSPHLAGLSDSTAFQEIAFDSKFFSLNQRVTCVAWHCSSTTTLGTNESLTATYSLSDKAAGVFSHAHTPSHHGIARPLGGSLWACAMVLLCCSLRSWCGAFYS